MEHIDMKCSLDYKLQIGYICSIRISYRNQDIIEKPMQLVWNPCENFNLIFQETKSTEQGVTQSDDDLEDVQSAAVRNFLKSSKLGMTTFYERRKSRFLSPREWTCPF